MTARRPTDGWRCASCTLVCFTPWEGEGRPLCAWCYREKVHEAEAAVVAQKLQRLGKRLRSITERDGWDCWLCGQPVDPYTLWIHRASADHVIPKSKGGIDALENLRLAHQSCNGYRAGARNAPFAPFDRDWRTDLIRERLHREALR